jgi:S-DNA-T family DNA segregation ATPase FtsK/SpoIIIE
LHKEWSVATVVLKRQPRRPAPELPSGEVIIDPPPTIPQTQGRNWRQLIMIAPIMAGAAALALLFSGGHDGGPLAYVTGGLFGVSALGLVGLAGMHVVGGKSKKEMILARRDYMRQLALHRRTVGRTAIQQREAMLYRHPDPGDLWATAASDRLWERRRNDADFSVIRVGVGPQELATPIVAPRTRPLGDHDPQCASALRQFLLTYSQVPDLPIAMAVNGFSRVYLRGRDDRVRAACRAILAQLAVHHCPNDVLIGICAAEHRRADWEWATWLPHTLPPHALHPEHTDALDELRLVAPSIPALEAMLDDLLSARPHFDPTAPVPHAVGQQLVLILDGGDEADSNHLMTEGGVEGVTVIDLHNAPPRLLDRATLVLDIDDDGGLHSRTIDGEAEIGRADAMSVAEIEALARQLAPLRMSASGPGQRSMSTALGLAELLDLGDPLSFDPATGWAPRPDRDRLRVPIGVSPDGELVELDLKESAEGGMGPHGLVVGATGAGKSELLRTLVLALAVTHDAETLNFVLVDVTGDAAFTTLDRLPHTSAVITNFADEPPLVDRMTDAINGELLRRQELLRRAGNFSSLRDYEQARVAGAPLSPVPSLLIICDEFSELLSAQPDLIDLFVQIGRVGPSLGVHLLLASRPLEENRLRDLDTHLSYRIGLRTDSATESRVVLNSLDAVELPPAPGHGFMKYGTEPLVRFRAAYVSGLYRRPGEVSGSSGKADAGGGVRDHDTRDLAPPVEAAEGAPEPDDDVDEALGQTLLDVLVGRLDGKGTPAHQVWLPPLGEPPTLDALLPPLVLDPEQGLTVSDPDLRGALKIPVGIVDRPLEQRRDVLTLDLAGSSGHAVVVGGPQSGKSTLLRTVIASMALTHTPREVQFYCLDFGGGALSSLRDLPHVGGVAARTDTAEVRRSVAEMVTLLEYRERRFAEHGVDGMATYRRQKRAGRHADDPFGDAFLVIDGWLTIGDDFEDLEPALGDLAARGLSYGIHVIAGVSRWTDLRPAIRDLFGTLLELRLDDPGDSYLDRRAAMNVPAATPGRGITPDKVHMLSGLPRIDGRPDATDLSDGLAAMVEDIRKAWPGPLAPAVRLLPDLVPYADIPTDAERGIAIGLAENDLGPVYLDLTADPHFVVYGDAECGKSAFLRAFSRRIVEQYQSREARIIMLDHRRSLLGTVTTDHLVGYGTSADTSTAIVNEVCDLMRSRLPGPDVAPEQLRTRSWYTGADLYLLVDDYDLVAAVSPNPLDPLVEFLPQARDIGLHLIVTRRSGGAGRAMHEQVLTRLRELSSPGLVMSGNQDEGALIGTVRPSTLPPGRGWLVTREDGVRVVQLAYQPPET